MQPVALSSFIPFVHVADVQASIDFYAHFGMELDSRFGPEGAPYWARMRSPNCDLMLALASGPIDPRVQAVLFYLHTPDLVALREHLLECGLADGGAFDPASPEPFPRTGKLFSIVPRDYMPLGEMRVHDPDGYVLLVGQIG